MEQEAKDAKETRETMETRVVQNTSMKIDTIEEFTERGPKEDEIN